MASDKESASYCTRYEVRCQSLTNCVAHQRSALGCDSGLGRTQNSLLVRQDGSKRRSCPLVAYSTFGLEMRTSTSRSELMIPVILS